MFTQKGSSVVGSFGGEPRVGVVGAGFIGRVHARSARLAGGRLVGVAASTPERSATAAAEMGAERGFESAEQLVAADDVDVVHLCTPNHLHVPLARAALAAGRHVVCEKPLATDVVGAQELAELARASGLVATVPFVYRFYPTVREARARVAAGDTGPLRLLHGGYLQDWLADPEDDSWRVDPDLGGPSRAYADIGSHWCDLVEFVSGHRISRLIARTAIAVPERAASQHREAFARGSGRPTDTRRAVSTEDIATVMFETDGGAAGSTVISQVSLGRKNALWFSIDGARAALAFEQERPEVLWAAERHEVRLVPRSPTHGDADARRLSVLPAGHPQGYRDCFDLFVADTYAAIGGDVPEGLPLFADGLRAARITDAVLRSAATEAWVEVPT